MRRLLAFVLCVLLASSLGLGSVAHADEGVAGVEISAATAVATGHHDGDRDEVPADGDKGYPHHHGACHGDHIGVPVTPRSVSHLTANASAALFPAQLAHAGLGSHPALRPPQA